MPIIYHLPPTNVRMYMYAFVFVYVCICVFATILLLSDRMQPEPYLSLARMVTELLNMIQIQKSERCSVFHIASLSSEVTWLI